jgi:Ni,Fe-hydrogenase III large subunit
LTQPELSPTGQNASGQGDHSREWILEVGPIHAGIIEPGRFEFRLAGEVVEKLTIHLGYTHKGIEQCFQTRRTLENGWELAERVAGDSSFAHSLAYCQAVEALAGLKMPPEANKLRALCLELERMAAHMGDCGALAHDVAFNLPASELAAMREEVLQINERLFGNRLLRGLNRPGAFVLPSNPTPEMLEEIRDKVQSLADSFNAWADALVHNPSFNDRLKWTGILPKSVAEHIGATGLIARASGILRDFRLLHPFGLYREDREVRRMILEELPSGREATAREATAGDTLARFLMRQREVRSSARIIDHVLGWWETHVGSPGEFSSGPEMSRGNGWRQVTGEDAQGIEYHTTTSWPVKWHTVDNYKFGLGYVEGWRGDIIYWVMKNKLGRILRCQPRDPSFLNWPALAATINLRGLDPKYIRDYEPPFSRVETLLSDFPVINKSFNLSYSGRDL